LRYRVQAHITCKDQTKSHQSSWPPRPFMR
jgi:hypothetical protein